MPQFELVWKPLVQSDETTSSNTKTFTVPTNAYWQVLSVYVQYTTTSFAGTRQLVVETMAPAATTFYMRKVASVTQAESTTYNYLFSPTEYEGLSLRVTSAQSHLTQALPLIILPPSYRIRIRDSVNVASDNCFVYLTLLQATA